MYGHLATVSSDVSPAVDVAPGRGGPDVSSLIAQARWLLGASARRGPAPASEAADFTKRLLVLGSQALRPDGLTLARRQAYVAEMQSIADRLEDRAPPNGRPGNYVDLRALVDGYLHSSARGRAGETALHRHRDAMLLCLRNVVRPLTLDDPDALRKLREAFEEAQEHLRLVNEKIAAAATRPVPLPRSSTLRTEPPPVPPRTYRAEPRPDAATETLRAMGGRSSTRAPSADGRWFAGNCMVHVDRADQVVDNRGGFMVVDMSGRSGSGRSPFAARSAADSGVAASGPQNARGGASARIRESGSGAEGLAASFTALSIKSAGTVTIGGKMTVFMGSSTSELCEQARRCFRRVAKLAGANPQGVTADYLQRAKALLDRATTGDKLPKVERQSCVKELRTIRNELRRLEGQSTKP